MPDLKTIIEENSAIAKENVADIHELIHGEADANAALSFDSTSKVSEWNLWTEVVSFISYILQLQWIEAKAELTEIKETGIAANKYFFAREWATFQYGDPLLINDETGKYYYETIDEDKQIIKRLAIIQGTNNWVVKVATEDSDANPIALSSDELAAFQDFVSRTQPPGPLVKVLSLESDKIETSISIYYDPIEDLELIKSFVETAYMDYLSKIDINGDSIYYISKHMDALQQVTGVTDVIMNSVQAKIDQNAYVTVVRRYEPFSGYLEHDPDLNLPDLITYTPEQ